MLSPGYVYHWTHQDNVESIRKYGLDPVYSQGAFALVWACYGECVAWALKHVAARHDWAETDMVLIVIPMAATAWLRSGVPQAVNCREKVEHGCLVSCSILPDGSVHFMSGPDRGKVSTLPPRPDNAA